MRKFSIVALAIVVLLALNGFAEAGLFGRRGGSCANGNCGKPSAAAPSPVLTKYALIPAYWEPSAKCDCQNGGKCSCVDCQCAPAVSKEKSVAPKSEPTLQAIAQARADAMAKKDKLDHAIHETTNAPNYLDYCSGEGVAISDSPENCAKPAPSRSVVADAWAQSAGGAIYRVYLYK